MASACVDTQEMGKGLQRCILSSSGSSKQSQYVLLVLLFSLHKANANLGILDLDPWASRIEEIPCSIILLFTLFAALGCSWDECSELWCVAVVCEVQSLI